MNRGANKTVGVGNRLDQGGVGGGKYVKGEQEQISNLLRRRSRYIQLVEEKEQISTLLRRKSRYIQLAEEKEQIYPSCSV